MVMMVVVVVVIVMIVGHLARKFERRAKKPLKECFNLGRLV